MKTLDQLIKGIERSSSKYLVRASIYDLAAFLFGFGLLEKYHGIGFPDYIFVQWLQQKYSLSNDKCTSFGILTMIYFDEISAFNSFFGEWNSFLQSNCLLNRDLHKISFGDSIIKTEYYSFASLMERVRLRPVLYLFKKSIILLGSYLNGYRIAKHDYAKMEYENQEFVFFSHFDEWIKKRLSVNIDRSWPHIILYASSLTSDEGQALDRFFALYNEFMAEIGVGNE